MQDIINSIKDIRAHKENVVAHVNELEKQLEQLELWQELQHAKSLWVEYDNDLKKLDAQLRNATISHYYQTGDKKPVAGVSVVINRVLHYQDSDAIHWAIEHDINFLTIDKRLFEKHAKAVVNTSPLDFVEFEEQPAVRISKDL